MLGNIQIKKSRLWIPALGVVVALGFFNNCAITPYFEACKTVDWTYLIITFSIILGLGSARDIVLRKFIYLGPVAEENKKAKKDILTNKVWIPFIGWCLVLGFANNIIVVQIFDWVKEINWEGLLAALSVILTVSGVREYGIYAKDNQHGTSSQVTDEEIMANRPTDF